MIYLMALTIRRFLTWAGCFLPFGLSASGKPVAPGTLTEWLLSLNE